MKIALVGLDWDLVDLIETSLDLEFLGVLDKGQVVGITKLGSDEDWPQVLHEHPGTKVVMGIDPPSLKQKLTAVYGEDRIEGLTSPRAYVSKRARLGRGSILQHGVLVMPKATVGNYCKLHINVTIHHEAIIGDFCTIAPGAQILGKVQIGAGTYIGAGAIIKQRSIIGENVVVGAGAVVINSVADGKCVVGVPASRELYRV